MHESLLAVPEAATGGDMDKTMGNLSLVLLINQIDVDL